MITHGAPLNSPPTIPMATLKILTADYAYNILSLITSATRSIDILAYVVKFNVHKRSDKANLIFAHLSKFARDNGTVRIILDLPRPHKPNYHVNKFSTRRLKEQGIITRYLQKGSTQHAKLFLFDQTTAVTGSHNFTPTSVTNKYDISLLFDSPPDVAYLVDLFNQLWDNSIEA